ncbi:folylpolyglutamate synthase, mitochondrial isoform X1 [Xiphophorus maculatus]|uniref:Folylpolyglutamate synthase n=2 Tax=Xiphophorus maculatus TaxID=8083 RepID=A0A3B5Q0E6_XIPMA|nr:folylpolyglutamate synthase, mitochondrial isoform X1 [Xiphophorus maculatus]
MMACLLRVLQRHSAFGASCSERDSVFRLASWAVRNHSTQAAPHFPGMEYQDAIWTLNTLQSNASVLQQARSGQRDPRQQLLSMPGFLERAGLTVEQLDHLNIIHITGTKGKGSTCAFTERILRTYGFRTGFYSSPHLVQVRERIRIDGRPISNELFTKYFWQVYGRLDETKEAHGGTMPAYFRFLTILAFHIFLQEKVDLAIIEVGIGGAYDCTNVVRRPWVCGIASLGIDHTQILGDTIEKIAWQKAGIFKPGVPAFTVRQPQEAMAVLRDRAREIQCRLRVCPDLDRYQTESGALQLGLAGQHQRSNASLALQLCHTWLQRRCGPDSSPALPDPNSSSVLQADSFRPGAAMVKGLADTHWAGRNQTLRRGAMTYFLDGAHTHRSMQACVQWFQEAAQSQSGASGAVVRVLLFNSTGQRDGAAMLKLLLPCHFDLVVFCPNIAETVATGNADQQNFNVTVEAMLTCCLDNERSWRLLSDGGDEYAAPLLIRDGPAPLAERKADSLVFPCILSALRWIAQGRDPVLTEPAQTAPPVTPSMAAKAALLQDAAHIHILVTGSLHLVGGVLKHLDPEDG